MNLATWLALAPILHAEVAQAQAQKVKLMEGTRLVVETVDELSSNKSRTGQEIIYRVRENVIGENKAILIRQGARAFGKIILAKGAGGLGRKGKLDFNIERVQAVDGSMVQLRSSQTANGKGKKGTMVALTLLVSPLALFMKGKNAKIPAGTQYEAYVDQNIEIDHSSDAGSPADATTPNAPAITDNDVSATATPPADARAHRIALKGGHTETGIVTGVSKDKLALVTEAGTLSIDCNKIVSIETIEGGKAQPMKIELRSGKSVTATLIGFKNGKWSVQAEDGTASIGQENLMSMSMNSATRELK